MEDLIGCTLGVLGIIVILLIVGLVVYTFSLGLIALHSAHGLILAIVAGVCGAIVLLAR